DGPPLRRRRAAARPLAPARPARQYRRRDRASSRRHPQRRPRDRPRARGRRGGRRGRGRRTAGDDRALRALPYRARARRALRTGGVMSELRARRRDRVFPDVPTALLLTIGSLVAGGFIGFLALDLGT